MRVVVVDDHPAMRRGTCAILSEAQDLEVVAQGADGNEALRLVSQHHPDVLVTDLFMPVKDGAEVVQELRRQGRKPGILILSASDRDEEIVKALRAGADGYVTKLAPEDLILQAVRLVGNGKPAILQSEVSQALLRSPHLQEGLTQRELEVLRGVAMDLGNKEIAVRLSISDRTVQQHLSNIYEKLAVQSRTGAVLKALQLGHLSLNELVAS